MSTVTPPASVRRVALGDLEQEMAQTRRVLERVPEERFGWKPHEKSFSLGHLAAHVANLPSWGITMVRESAFDLATLPPPDPASAPKTRDELLARFDAGLEQMLEALDAADEGALTDTWTLRKGEHVVFQLPRAAAIRGMIISHVIHHRAQLTVYLRMLDVPVPGLYGPSADEQ